MHMTTIKAKQVSKMLSARKPKFIEDIENDPAMQREGRAYKAMLEKQKKCPHKNKKPYTSLRGKGYKCEDCGAVIKK